MVFEAVPAMRVRRGLLQVACVLLRVMPRAGARYQRQDHGHQLKIVNKNIK